MAASLLSLYLARRNEEADQKHCEQNLRTIATSLEMYSSFTVSCGGRHHGSVRLIYTAEEGFVRKPAP